MRKKILFIITQSEFGGAQRFLSTLVPRLDPQKYDILVATGSTGDKHFTDHLNNLNIRNTTLRHLVRNPHVWHDYKAIGEIRNLIKSFDPSTLFLLSTKAGWLGSLAARKFPQIKVIYRIGGWAFNDPQNALRRRIIIWAERLSARWKDIIILNNKHDLEQAQSFGIHPRISFKLIYNGIDVYKMKFLDKDTARGKLRTTTPFVVGTIANFYPSKGLEYFIEMANAFIDRRDITFVVIGSGNIKYTHAHNVSMPGRIPEASRLLPAFDIFISPSIKEGFQWAVLEAMAAKVPVIATSVGATPELIDNGKNGFLVDPRKPQQITDCLKILLDNDRQRQEFGIQGHQTVLHKFDLEHMVQEVGKTL